MVHARSVRRPRLEFDLPLILIVAMIGLLWLAGGASREDVLGQVVVRGGAWAIIAIAILAGPRPKFGALRPVLFVLLATITLPFLQLIPLPPTWWQALPGREVLLIPGATPPWRPWTMTPGATRNALASLVVPAAMLLLLAQSNEKTRNWLPVILLTTVVSAVLLGLLQFSGARFNNPFLNDTPGLVSGIFANRNHFALLVAIGCLVAPVWAFRKREALSWRGPVAVGLILLFVLTILATGSRAGMPVGALALALAFALVGRPLRRSLKRAPRWVLPTLLSVGVMAIGGVVWLSVAADRAVSINRLLLLQTDVDLRTRALPVVLAMIDTYLPFGTGFGSFDPIFRIHEPLALLEFAYFNEAHNDFLGVVLDGGVPALVVLAAAVGWWLIATIRAWRATATDEVALARLGSSILLLIFLASAADYPARTPTIMALIVIAATWMARGTTEIAQTALPARVRDL